MIVLFISEGLEICLLFLLRGSLSPNSSIITGCPYILKGESHMKISIRQLKALIQESVSEVVDEGVENSEHEDLINRFAAALAKDKGKNPVEILKTVLDTSPTSPETVEKELNSDKYQSLMSEARKLKTMIRATIKTATKR